MKHLKLFFALFAMLALGVGNAWAEEVTFNFKTIAQTSGTTGGISWGTGKTGSATNTACNSTNGLVLYGVASGGGYFQTTSPTSGAITNVSITSSAKKNTPKYTIYGSTDGSTWTSIESGITAGTKDHAITGAYTYFKIANTTAATAQLAITTLTITYETAGGETPGEGGGEEPTPDPEEPETGGETWTLVTNASDLKAGDQVVIAASGYNYAMASQNGNYRNRISITKDGNNITINNDVQILTIEEGTKSNTYAFNTGSGYLYACSSSSNYLKTQDDNNDNGSWAITITNTGEASIVAQGSYTRNMIQYNASSGSERFSCYATDKPQKPVSIYKKITSSGSGSGEPVASLVQIAHTGNKTIFTEGDPFVKSTITATYDDENTKDVTSLATFEGYDMNTTGTQTVNVSYTEGDKTATTTYNITVNPKPTYTITWNNAGSTTETTVKQGEAFGELPTVADCSNGKKFMGWTAATSVNNDGSGVIYIKSTDKPTANTTYYAVFAVEKVGEGEVGSADVTLSEGNFAGSKITWDSDYATIVQEKVSGSTAVNGSYVASPRWYVGHEVTITPKTTINITAITINQGTGDYAKFDQATATNASIAIDGQTVTITPLDGTKAVVLSFAKQVRPTSINIAKGPATTYSDYSLNCDISVEPTWTISKNEIAFADKYVGFEYTETFTINASNLAEDIALAIDGSTFTVSPTSIAKDATFPQTVTVTYAPTAVGTHNATLNITSGSTLSKTIALTGSATEATIYTLTALANINPKDKVIIVGTSGGNTYAMSNDNGTSKAPKAVAVTVADDKIATKETNILWNIAKNGDNLTIYPADQTEKWLYCLADANDGVRVGTGNAKEFTIDKGYLYTTQTTSARHIGIYNNADWRCYKPSDDAIHTNIAGQTFAFYVLPNTDPSISVSPASKDFGAVIVGNTLTQEFEISTLNVTSALTAEITGDACFTATGINAGKITVTYAPTAVGNYTATLTITAGTEATKTIELKGEAVETVNVATAMAAAKDEIVYLKPFDVVYAVTGKEYVYIKDESGFGLIYDTDLANQLLNGDRVEGFVGKSSPYRSLPELKAHNTENMTITHGTAVEPTEFTTVPATSHVNQYVVFKNVTFDEDVVFNSSTATNATFKLNTNDVTLRNSFKFEVAFEADKAYDIYGAIATYQATESDPIEVQVYYLNSAEAGQEVVTYTVNYDANGASGNVPKDLANYSAGQQVTVAGQGEMTYENHMFTGWKYNGTIYQAGDKFNMPADDVTLVAQWEERQTFSSGLWVLVSDANELAADDYIIVAAKDYNVAMVSYDYDVRKNNCGQTNITKFGKDNCFLTWTEDVGVFQLTASGENYTIQDVNTKQYLYAAGGTTSNHLKATDAVDTDAENMPKYIWEISIVDGITTVKAMSEGRNTLKYNSTATSGQLFSCYASGQKDIVLYKYTTDFYTRDVTKNQYGTICLDKGGVPVSGATFYEVAYKNTQTNRVLVDEVVRLKAGVPYVFLPNAVQIKIALDGTTTTATGAQKVNGLQGTFVEIQDGDAGDANNVLEGKHMLYNNSILKCGGNCKLPAYRAYFIVDEISTEEKPSAPGRQRVALGYQGENAATGLDNITESGVIAPAMQGTYDVLGRQLSEPTATGFYIVNGKKVFVVK